jgi:hypothetical protein
VLSLVGATEFEPATFRPRPADSAAEGDGITGRGELVTPTPRPSSMAARNSGERRASSILWPSWRSRSICMSLGVYLASTPEHKPG